MSIKINKLTIENTKRVKAFEATLGGGLTVIGGGNSQGKTSVLDAITYLLGGERYRPGVVQTEGTVSDPYMRAELSNGLLVERKGKNSTLTVTDTTGAKSGQRLLDSFVEELALNLPKFLAQKSKEKADTLLRILGIGDQLASMEAEEKRLYELRADANREADRKKKHADEMEEFADAPDELEDAGEILAELDDIASANARRMELISKRDGIASGIEMQESKADSIRGQIKALTAQLATCEAEKARLVEVLKDTEMPGEPEDPVFAKKRLATIEETNRKVRANMDKAAAMDAAKDAALASTRLSQKLEDARKLRLALLDGAAMPLPGLSIDNGELTYSGKPWDCMSGSERLRTGVAIVQALRPDCGFVLVDGLEGMDAATLDGFGKWLDERGLQCIGTRVSTGDECHIIIEDGIATVSDSEPVNELGF